MYVHNNAKIFFGRGNGPNSPATNRAMRKNTFKSQMPIAAISPKCWSRFVKMTRTIYARETFKFIYRATLILTVLSKLDYVMQWWLNIRAQIIVGLIEPDIWQCATSAMRVHAAKVAYERHINTRPGEHCSPMAHPRARAHGDASYDVQLSNLQILHYPSAVQVLFWMEI